jgi:hypothetical protein
MLTSMSILKNVSVTIAFYFPLFGAALDAGAEPVKQRIEKALAYLAKEVHEWPKEKECYSCHNSGDGARALYIAKQHGHSVDNEAIANTTDFLQHPENWHAAAGDEAFKDEKLATIQFAAALVEARRAKQVGERASPAAAAELLVGLQDTDGAWHVDQTGFGGSPVTYGDALATAMSRRVLAEADHERFAKPIAAADQWLRTSTKLRASKRTVDAAGALLALADAEDKAAREERTRCTLLLVTSQDRSGGWGPFDDYEPEAFDTAIAILGLAALEDRATFRDAIRRGCAYLAATQTEDGSWVETTRPSGWDSYAHRVSTTAWATIALLQTDVDDLVRDGLPRRPAVTVKSVKELGVVGKPKSVLGRDGGESAVIGGKMLWTFGDTIFHPAAEDGSHFRTNTAALADPAEPLAVHEPTSADGIPFQAIPFTDEERKYNASTGRPDDRIALWTGGIVPTADGRGLAFFSLVHVGEGLLNYTHRGIATAYFAPGETTATRNDGLLFLADEPGFARPLAHEGTLYLYGGLPDRKDLAFGVARAPLGKATEREAYEFWNGREWTSKVSETAPVFARIPGGVTISYNAHLQSYIAVHSGVLTTEVLLRTAPRPEGPWSEPVELFRGEEPEEGFNYAALEHPELAKDNGRRIYITYHRPLPGLRGELRLVEVTFE